MLNERDHIVRSAFPPSATLKSISSSRPNGETPDSSLFWKYCDECDTRLESFRGRMVCPKCGFFQDDAEL